MPFQFFAKYIYRFLLDLFMAIIATFSYKQSDYCNLFSNIHDYSDNRGYSRNRRFM